jgi:hypothetical protein
MPPPPFRNAHAYQNTVSGDAPTKQKANAANQPLRRKFLDEARLKRVGLSSFEHEHCLFSFNFLDVSVKF